MWKKELDWSSHMDSLFKNGTEPTVLFKETQILPRPWAPLLSTPCQTALTTALFFGVMKWGDGSHTADRNRINKLIINLSSRLHHGINKRKKKQRVSEARALSNLDSTAWRIIIFTLFVPLRCFIRATAVVTGPIAAGSLFWQLAAKLCGVQRLFLQYAGKS